MAQLEPDQLLLRAIRADGDPGDCLLALMQRQEGRVAVDEGPNIDFKMQFSLDSEAAIAEISRDVLAFSNTEGGIILFGVSDTGEIVGHSLLDPRKLRERLGPYTGTRLDFEISTIRPVVKGHPLTVPSLLVRRSTTAYPNLLRKDIAFSGKLSRKVKYLAGSLFYREGAQTKVEPTGGDINAKSVELRFTGTSPRTRSSFALEEDRPGVRLYAHINDRFFGRNSEVAHLCSIFEDQRGRGISIAGQGGIGKTELAIEIVSRLYKSGRFKSIYSASAKTVLLGPAGAQPTDPVFHDFPSFLRDLLAWLGFDSPAVASSENLEKLCLPELSARQRTLLFLDNLETVDDPRLFEYLDSRLPPSVWLITTSRVHRIKNWIYTTQLGEMESRDAAHHLRYELKRQGLQEYASSDIRQLEQIAQKLHRHPLAIRWYSWACKNDDTTWKKGPEGIPKRDLEAFCVGHTLRTLSATSQKVLAALATTAGLTQLTPKSTSAVSRVSGSALEFALYELECAGLISPVVDDETGQLSYSVVPLASAPARELARKNHWETTFAKNLHSFLKDEGQSLPDDPLLRDLVDLDPRKIRTMGEDDRSDLKSRIERANRRPHAFKSELLYLLAECERHSGNIITADEVYRTAAEEILKSNKYKVNQKLQAILLEAATVAKSVGPTESQLQRAVRYLEVIENTAFHALRILGSLAELHAMLGHAEKYEHYRRRVTNLRDKESWRFSPTQLSGLQDALDRARAYIKTRAPTI